MRMKEVWYYHIHLFEGGEKLAKRLRRTTDRAEYCAAVGNLPHAALNFAVQVGRAETERPPRRSAAGRRSVRRRRCEQGRRGNSGSGTASDPPAV